MKKVIRLKATGRKPKLENLYLRVRPRMAYIDNPNANNFRVFTNLGKAAMDMIFPKWLKKAEVFNQTSFIHFINLYSNYGFSADVPKSELPRTDIRRMNEMQFSYKTKTKGLGDL